MGCDLWCDYRGVKGVEWTGEGKNGLKEGEKNG